MISQFQKKDIDRYEKSIVELKKQRDDANFDLQKQIETKDRLISEIGSLERTKKDLSHFVDSLNSEVKKIESIIETRELCRVDVIKRHSEYVTLAKNEEKIFKTELSKLSKEITERKKELEKIPEQEKILENLNKDIEIKNREINIISQNILIAEKKFEKIGVAQTKNEKELDERYKKLSALNIEIEEKLGKIQIYVQRLQGYYDESGVKLQILEEFNLKNL